MNETTNYEDAERCRECGGKCCKGLPGGTTPEEWGAPNRTTMKKRLIAAFKTDNWSIDWWEGDPRPDVDELGCAKYVRPATKNNHRGILDGSWGGECMFLTSTGCRMELEKRPFDCRVLEPRKEGCVTHGGGKHDIAIMWIEYNDLLDEIVDELNARG